VTRRLLDGDPAEVDELAHAVLAVKGRFLGAASSGTADRALELRPVLDISDIRYI
jgi:hypothetical protein